MNILNRIFLTKLHTWIKQSLNFSGQFKAIVIGASGNYIEKKVNRHYSNKTRRFTITATKRQSLHTILSKTVRSSQSNLIPSTSDPHNHLQPHPPILKIGPSSFRLRSSQFDVVPLPILTSWPSSSHTLSYQSGLVPTTSDPHNLTLFKPLSILPIGNCSKHLRSSQTDLVPTTSSPLNMT